MLIDGENAQSSLIDKMVAETGKYGLVTVRRIYGDWTTPQMKSWKDVLNDHAIQPIQQFRYTIGKNSSDSSLIIDAMDILYEGTVHGFLPRFQRQRLHTAGHPHPEKGLFRDGHRAEKHPARFRESLPGLCLHGEPDAGKTNRQIRAASRAAGIRWHPRGCCRQRYEATRCRC